MKALVAASLMVAGCSFEPTALMISPNVDAGIDAIDGPSEPLDPDGDGILSVDDNCPLDANPGQENEDRDLFGNVCDLCPHLPSDSSNDGDADGVGDACDPQPGVENTWLYFEGFDAPLDTDDWVGAGDFNVSGGQLRSNDNAERYFLRYEGLEHGETVLVGSRIGFANPLGPNGISFRFGGPVVREGTNLGNNNGCWVLRAISQGMEGYAFVESTTDLSAPVFQEETLPDAPVNVRVTVDGNDYGCSFDPDGDSPVELIVNSVANQGRNRIGLVSSFSEMNVDYLFAISTQESPAI